MASTGAKIKLTSLDGVVIEVEEAVAAKSQILKKTMDDIGVDRAIPLPNVTSKIAEKVFEYCKRHVEAETKATGELTAALAEFDAEFVKVDQDTLIDIILAAHYLDINSLLNLTCKTVANMMTGKSPEEVRTIFNIKNDYTPAEEEKIRKENEWAFK